ncbi:MAG: branched-chain amino acid ABC transporter permease [Anabaena sp. CoA2_C59]|jgi:neutral amino acid transport system permease protein|uniref:Branched-chain amino acid ABC transporter n=1 Tax=Aphanizomenon flos-aquae WA102 TaxID=1710896 RepID=A0A1B7X4D2_APHFL|nr:branched-chain amino acid ABC transporter permease [Anabaena sp. CoA2_C59]MDJ0504598.1 branched-chain amino acid ABC transporter permease [Nostocales cyanobacterium LE14-WE12]NTW20052.1 branched-chain amino acid ABC transporter permease [Nostocales cyanobacterium W4_Combined_metabat2_030]OBQ27565.1 MAG: branched-chain amino acid ABC transporter [Aphanizomenon flos-aquae MDT14a]OBQ44150.1 MAG: branched-chain amino acid ABC transporter [Aphanizomenon flos-aquae WA102]QSV68352.1 MAG: branched-
MIEYLIFLAISTATFALFGLGLNLQWGFTGLINFGHIAFMTLGAYTMVLLSLKGVSLLLSAIIGAIVAASLGLVIGFATLRLREDYLSIVTIGTGELIRLIVNNQELPVGNTWISGSFGVQSYVIPLSSTPNLFFRIIMIVVLNILTGITLFSLWRWVQTAQISASNNIVRNSSLKQEFISRLIVGIALGLLAGAIYISGVIGLYNYNPKAGLMLLVLLILAFVFWRLEILVRSPWGRVLKSIREDEEIPKALGKNVFSYKLQSLMLGGAIAGIAGAFFAWQLAAIYPDNFQPQLTFDAWIMVILGGSGNNLGTILGAVMFFAYDALTREFLPKIVPLDVERIGAFRIMFIGLLLMVLMIWRPQGILGKKEELTLGK